MYWVIGGVYANTEFKDIAPDHTEQRYGPFETFQEALSKWHEKSWLNVDDALARFTIKEERELVTDMYFY